MIPLYSLLIIFTIFLAIFFIFLIINVYHIVASASFTLPSFVVTFFVTATSLLILYGTWFLLQGIDWQQPLIDLGGFSNARF